MKSIAVTLYLPSIAVVACAGNTESMQPADGQPVAEMAPSPTAELPPHEAPAEVAKAKPTKGAAADLLVKLCRAIERRDLDAIMSCWHSFPESYEANAVKLQERQRGTNLLEFDRSQAMSTMRAIASSPC